MPTLIIVGIYALMGFAIGAQSDEVPQEGSSCLVDSWHPPCRVFKSTLTIPVETCTQEQGLRGVITVCSTK